MKTLTFKRLLCLALALLLPVVQALAEAETPPETGEMIYMRAGDSGAGVQLLQQRLIEEGYLEGEADGVYGAATQDAVRAFAAASGFAADGEVRLDLLRALDPDAATSLDTGARGLMVYAVQKLLYTYGFLDVAPDGSFGANTKKAAKGYMTAMGEEMAARQMAEQEQARAQAEAEAASAGSLPVAVDVPLITAEDVLTDGRIDADWLELLLDGAMPAAATVEMGERSIDALRVQKRLKALGYLAAGTDGVFGNNTQLALKYFQRRNGLDVTGACDERTQQLLFSDAAERSDQYVSPYKAVVSTKQNKTWFYRWTGAGYDELAKTFTCTTGAAKTPTIKGTFQAPGQAGEWYEMKKSRCWVRYAFVIDGGYFFHSVLYNSKGASKPTSSSVSNLGRNASHGCIRLAVDDARWVYENCAPGMTVVIE